MKLICRLKIFTWRVNLFLMESPGSLCTWNKILGVNDVRYTLCCHFKQIYIIEKN